MRGADRTFYNIESCGYDTSKEDCEIAMSVLVAEPWNLRKGDVIYARVHAINEKGEGLPAFSNDRYTLKTEPRQMPTPQL